MSYAPVKSQDDDLHPESPPGASPPPPADGSTQCDPLCQQPTVSCPPLYAPEPPPYTASPAAPNQYPGGQQYISPSPHVHHQGPPPGQYQGQFQGPPQGHYHIVPPAQYPQGATTQTIVIQTAPAAAPYFGLDPVPVVCPHCSAEVVTATSTVVGLLPWLVCGVLFLAGFLILLITWFFCCVPFCIGSLQDVVHKCPNCQAVLGRLQRLKL